jgi:hypothetical protein
MAAPTACALNVMVLNESEAPEDHEPLLALTVEYVLSHVADDAATHVMSVLFN